MNIKVKISDKIKKSVPSTKLGLIYSEVTYQKYNPKLWEHINNTVRQIKEQHTFETIKNIPQILSTRQAYKALGKEPARYRPSAEALFRRIVKDKGLYQISNLVDTINLASLITGYSIGGYDFDKIKGDIIFDVGKPEEEYYGVGRGKLNIENLPVFRDDLGPFGSPTSDSERTKITEQTKRLLLIVINFGDHQNFLNDLLGIKRLLFDYANGKCFYISVIE